MTAVLEGFSFYYSRLSLNGHLYKTDTSVKRTPRVGPCLSLLPLFDSIRRTSLLDRHLVPAPKVSDLERVDCISETGSLTQ